MANWRYVLPQGRETHTLTSLIIVCNSTSGLKPYFSASESEQLSDDDEEELEPEPEQDDDDKGY